MARNADTCPRLLDRHVARATFPASDWIVAQHPGVIAEIVCEGHEVACHFDRADGAAFVVREVASAKQRREAAAGRVVLGFRASSDLMPAITGPAGFRYDCSLDGQAHATCQPDVGCRLTVSSFRLARQDWPCDSGAVHRQVPGPLLQHYLARWRTEAGTRAFWFELWELDPDLPQLAILGGLKRLLCYRNLALFPDRLARLLDTAPFVPVRGTLMV